jgi:hypothetical protein
MTVMIISLVEKITWNGSGYVSPREGGEGGEGVAY